LAGSLLSHSSSPRALLPQTLASPRARRRPSSPLRATARLRSAVLASAPPPSPPLHRAAHALPRSPPLRRAAHACGGAVCGGAAAAVCGGAAAVVCGGAAAVGERPPPRRRSRSPSSPTSPSTPTSSSSPLPRLGEHPPSPLPLFPASVSGLGALVVTVTSHFPFCVCDLARS
jgi:hypothetical protein